MTTTACRYYYIALNDYANSTGHGFANTWTVYRCRDAAQQKRLLTRGLPLPDRWLIGQDGKYLPEYSTNGIRLATPAEIRKARKVEQYGESVPVLPDDEMEFL